MPFQVHATVASTVGKFTGFLSGDLESHDEAVKARDDLQEVLRKCDMITMFCDQQPGTEITLNEGVIKNSVFVMAITTFPAATA